MIPQRGSRRSTLTQRQVRRGSTEAHLRRREVSSQGENEWVVMQRMDREVPRVYRRARVGRDRPATHGPHGRDPSIPPQTVQRMRSQYRCGGRSSRRGRQRRWLGMVQEPMPSHDYSNTISQRHVGQCLVFHALCGCVLLARGVDSHAVIG